MKNNNLTLAERVCSAKNRAAMATVQPNRPLVTEAELSVALDKKIVAPSPSKRSIKHTVMVYPHEDALIRQHAVEAGLSLSEYIRQSTVDNVLSERRSNDLRDASLDVFGGVRTRIVPAIATMQILYREMPQGNDRDKLMSIAQQLTQVLELINRRERELCF